jgi:hypothetical protein
MLLPILPAWFGRYPDPILDWRPAFILVGCVLATAILHMLVPGFGPDRPRGMNLVYRQADGADQALLYVESPGGEPDRVFTEAMNFVTREMPGRYATSGVVPYTDHPTISRPALETTFLGMSGAEISDFQGPLEDETGGPEFERYRFTVQAPDDTRLLVLAFPEDISIVRATVEGVSAIDRENPPRRGSAPRLLRIAYPDEPMAIELLIEKGDALSMAVTAMQALPAGIYAQYAHVWPDDALPVFYGSRAEVVSEFRPAGD